MAERWPSLGDLYTDVTLNSLPSGVPVKRELLLPILKMGNRGPEKLNTVPKLVKGNIRITPKHAVPRACLLHHCPSSFWPILWVFTMHRSVEAVGSDTSWWLHLYPWYTDKLAVENTMVLKQMNPAGTYLGADKPYLQIAEIRQPCLIPTLGTSKEVAAALVGQPLNTYSLYTLQRGLFTFHRICYFVRSSQVTLKPRMTICPSPHTSLERQKETDSVRIVEILSPLSSPLCRQWAKSNCPEHSPAYIFLPKQFLSSQSHLESSLSVVQSFVPVVQRKRKPEVLTPVVC